MARNESRGDDEESQGGNDDDIDTDNDDLDEDHVSDDDDDGDIDFDEDGDNQVVPWAATPPPPAASSSCSEEEASLVNNGERCDSRSVAAVSLKRARDDASDLRSQVFNFCFSESFFISGLKIMHFRLVYLQRLRFVHIRITGRFPPFNRSTEERNSLHRPIRSVRSRPQSHFGRLIKRPESGSKRVGFANLDRYRVGKEKSPAKHR